MQLLGIVCVAVYSLHSVLGSCPDVDRAGWGADPPRISPLGLEVPAPYVVIHHTYIPAECGDSGACTKAMRTMQHMHQIVNGWNDIGYNFAIGGDGVVYEGRGWDVVGAHAPKYNFKSIGICFIGDYRTVLPPAAMLEAAHALIRCGVDRGSILANYTLVGHRQVRDTECPGSALFQEIQNWPHWEDVRDIQTRKSATTTTTPAAAVEDVVAPDEVANPGNPEAPDANELADSTQ